MRVWRLALVCCAAGLCVSGSFAGTSAPRWQAEPEGTVLAVVTRKAGLGARLAHDHLIVAPASALAIDYDLAAPLQTRATLTLRVADLAVDDPVLQDRWQNRLLELGLLDQGYGRLSEGTRQKVRRAMLGRDQLDAESHPELVAEIVEVRRSSNQEFPFEVDLRLTVRGQSAAATARARFVDEVDGGPSEVEALADFRFSDFGLRPYSALLGAVKNRDTFHVFVRLRLVERQDAR